MNTPNTTKEVLLRIQSIVNGRKKINNRRVKKHAQCCSRKIFLRNARPLRCRRLHARNLTTVTIVMCNYALLYG